MKIYITIAVFLCSTIAVFAQKKPDLKLNKETNLIEATYYYENGVVSQEGTFTVEGKLNGKWESFDTDGKKVASGYYTNGVKTGKWFFWTADKLKEVDYTNNAIVSVSEWRNKSDIALKNK